MQHIYWYLLFKQYPVKPTNVIKSYFVEVIVKEGFMSEQANLLGLNGVTVQQPVVKEPAKGQGNVLVQMSVLAI